MEIDIKNIEKNVFEKLEFFINSDKNKHNSPYGLSGEAMRVLNIIDIKKCEGVIDFNGEGEVRFCARYDLSFVVKNNIPKNKRKKAVERFFEIINWE